MGVWGGERERECDSERRGCVVGFDGWRNGWACAVLQGRGEQGGSGQAQGCGGGHPVGLERGERVKMGAESERVRMRGIASASRVDVNRSKSQQS